VRSWCTTLSYISSTSQIRGFSLSLSLSLSFIVLCLLDFRSFRRGLGAAACCVHCCLLLLPLSPPRHSPTKYFCFCLPFPTTTTPPDYYPPTATRSAFALRSITMVPERHVSQSLVGCTHLDGVSEHFTNLTPGAQAPRQISRRGLPVWTRQRQRCPHDRCCQGC
jgi:hypothetical protein